MKIKNSYIATLANLLYEIELTGTESRMRTKLWKILVQEVNNIDSEIGQLVDDFKKVDKEGNAIFKNENDKYPIVDDEKFNAPYIELMNETLVIDNNEQNKKMLTTVANIFLKQDIKVNMDLAVIYDEICEEFENVLAYYNKSNNKNNRNYKKYNNRK